MKKRVLRGMILVLLFIPLLAFWTRKTPYAGRIEINIGNFSTELAGQRASLQVLASELKRCPNAQTFTIKRNSSGLKWFAEEDHEQLFYDRKTGFLQDGKPLFGATEQWQVKNDAIEKVAATTRRFADLEKYGGKNTLP